MATYGEIRLSISKQVPGVDSELIDGFILDKYQEILDTMSWSRIKASLTIQSPAEVNAGTVTANLGNGIITGAGTAWTPEMTGRIIRIGLGEEYYQFTFQDASTGLLDRAYEGTATGAGIGYRINQNVFPLPANVRIVEAVRSLDTGWELNRNTSAQLNFEDSARVFYGTPCYWNPTFDQQSTPPQPQIEIYPVPDKVFAMAIECVLEDVSFGTKSSSIAQTWARPSCIKAGARSLAEAHLKDFEAAKYWNGEFVILLAQIVGIESQRIGPQQMRMASRFTQHRINRVLNTNPRHSLPG